MAASAISPIWPRRCSRSSEAGNAWGRAPGVPSPGVVLRQATRGQGYRNCDGLAGLPPLPSPVSWEAVRRSAGSAFATTTDRPKWRPQYPRKLRCRPGGGRWRDRAADAIEPRLTLRFNRRSRWWTPATGTHGSPIDSRQSAEPLVRIGGQAGRGDVRGRPSNAMPCSSLDLPASWRRAPPMGPPFQQ